MKTNALRILEAAHIPHEWICYESAEGEIDAVSVAETLGVEAERVFKTLVARGSATGVIVFCIPGPCELDLKKAAAVSGNKSLDLVKARELKMLTGYVRGGCSPVGMKKAYPTWIDETALLFDRIYVSAGAHGIQVLLTPQHLAAVVEANFADVI